jgi:SWIM zinc finger
MPIEIEKIEQLAPDQASLSAAAKLKKPGLWPLLACDTAGLVWGECQGSGASPYRVICSEADFSHKCTCPSRKFPCKHTLALMWMRADGVLPFKTEAAPAWVGDWLARRRPGAAAAKKDAAPTEVKASAAQAAAVEPAVDDPKAAARAAVQRERNKADREASIRAGLDELDTWIADALQGGLASFLPAVSDRCRKIAQRLVDAKATGLAGLVERLPSDLISLPEPLRSDALIERLATLYLIACAYRNQDRLPHPVKADVRQVVGWAVTRDALLADREALRVKDRWMVVGTIVEVQADKLRRLETWLSRLGEGAGPRFAVLIDFVPVSLGKATNMYATGEVFLAELVYFNSPAPLRAIVAEQIGSTEAGERWPRPADDVPCAIARLNNVLSLRPWSDDIPFAAHGARIVASGASLWVTDAEGTAGLPLRTDEDDSVLPLVGINGIDAFGRWDGNFLSLTLCETPLGRWVAG